jgi:uncharacterized protein (TIGR03437 family)
MRLNRLLLTFVLLVLPGFAATFGTVVARPEGFSDIVLDEARNRLYLVNTSANTLDVYSIATNPPSRVSSVRVGAQPISAALSRSGKYLYVTNYSDSTLSTIDLARLATLPPVTLAAKPQGVAVGYDERVLISTIGDGRGQAVLVVYDPSQDAAHNLTAVVIAPPAPTSPTLPPPSGRVFLEGRGRLLASADGRIIIGVNNLSNNTRTVFVYDARSATVLRSRNISTTSPGLAIAPDGSKFMSGITLFDTDSLTILAQQNTANSPFPFPGGSASALNLQQNQGGSIFSPDGQWLYAGFNLAPVQTPAARTNISRLLYNDPDNLIISFGLQITENLTGKMVITADGRTIYALSESGFVKLPISNIGSSPIAVPDSAVMFLANDQCGVTADQQAGGVQVKNAGSGRMNITANLLQIQQSGGIGLGGGSTGSISILLPPQLGGGRVNVGSSSTSSSQGSAATSPYVKAQPSSTGADVLFQFNPQAARSLGTVAPHDFLLQSSEAINIPPNVRVYQNNRNSEAKGAIYPVSIGTTAAEGLVDMVVDNARQRLYIANSGLNRVEVFDMRQKTFLTPIKAGQLPRSLALEGDGSKLYIANNGSEFISVADPSTGKPLGRIKLPPIAFNASLPLVTPSVIAWTQRGLQIIMSDGTLWKVVGDTAQPRLTSTSHPVFGSSRSISGPIRTMAASPEGDRLLVLAGNGNAYLYDANVDDFVVGRQVIASPITGYYGPISAGPGGSYYVVNNLILNSSLTQIGSAPVTTVNPGGQTAPTTDPSQPPDIGPIIGPITGSFPSRGGATTVSRPVAAVASAGARNFVRFSGPVRLSQNQQSIDAGIVELVEVSSGRTLGYVNALETPLATVVGNQRTNTNGRTRAVDSSGNTAYVLTTSGLSALPLDTTLTSLRDAPVVNRNGVVSNASYLPQLAPGAIFSIFGKNLAADGTAGATPLPTVLGGTCVTLGNTPVPLLMTANGQVNGQIPPGITAGRYTMVVRSIDRQVASGSTNLTIAKYAPAVFVNNGQPAILHTDGRYVSKDAPAQRDERLVIYATGLGPTKGGKVTAGAGAPSSPLAVTDKVQVFFGNPGYSQAEVIVEWSGLVPGSVGLYQINVRIPGLHMKGSALPVQLRIGGVNSPSTGPAVPYVAVE